MAQGRILVVDDDPIVRRTLSRMLEEEGYEIGVAASGAEALECAANERFDVALVDIRIPDPDGMEVLRALQEMDEDLKALIITGYPALETAIEAVRLGAFDYLPKPLENQRVLVSVQNALMARHLAVTNKQLVGDLQEANESLRHSNRELADARTELARVNEGLRAEIAQREEAQKALKESEEKYRTLTESTPDAIFILDHEARFQYVNRCGLDLLGATLEEVLGKTVSQFLSPETAEQQVRALQEVLTTGKPLHLELQLPFPAGVWHDIWLVPLVVQNGQVQTVMGITRDITERKRAEEALAEERNLLRTLIDNLPDCIYVKDIESRFVAGNKAVARLMGVAAPEELLGKTDFSFYPRELATQYHADEQQVIRSGEPLVNREEPLMDRLTDRRGWLQTTKVPLRDSHGEIVGIVGIGRDITEHRRAEEALRESEQRFRTIVEAAPSLLVITDDKGDTTYVSPNCEEITGYTQEELQGRFGWWVHDQDARWAKEVFDRVFRQGRGVKNLEYKAVKKNGELWHASTSSVRLVDKDGTVKGFVFQTIDITERKRMEEALWRWLGETGRGRRLLLALSQAAEAVQRARTPEEVYRTVANEVADMGYHAVIFTLTDDGAHLTISHLTFEPALVEAAEELAGVSIEDFCAPLVPGGFLHRVVDGGEAAFSEPTSELMAEALPGPLRPLAGRLMALLGLEQAIFAPLTVHGQTRGVLAVTGAGLTEADVPAVTAFANQAAIAIENARLMDAVTKHERDLERLSAQLINAQEAERKRISQELHDELGQVLTAIRINLGAIEKELGPALASAARERLAEAGLLAEQMVEEIRELALDLRPAMLDDLGLVPALRWYVNRYSRSVGLPVELEVVDFEERAPAEVETVLYRVMQEALTNVARHAQATRVRVRLERKESAVAALVEDNGQGFCVEEAAGREAPMRGTGLLGMQERVALLGGIFSIQSRLGHGTQLCIEIPLRGRDGS